MSITTPNIQLADEKCLLLGSQGLWVQFFLGAFTVAVAITKRYFENPMRHWVIWLMDILKQFIGLLFIHTFNVIAAAKFSAMATQGDECSWYFIIYLVDIVFTTGMSFLIMTRLDKWFDANGYKNLVSGNYFKGFQISVCYWTEQMLIWLIVISAIKTVLYMLQLPVIGLLGRFSEWVLQILNFSMTLKLIVVIVIVPIVGNAIQFWIIDTILKKKSFEGQHDSMIRDSYFTAKVENEPLVNTLPATNQPSFLVDRSANMHSGPGGHRYSLDGGSFAMQDAQRNSSPSRWGARDTSNKRNQP